MCRRKGVCMGKITALLHDEYENNHRFRRYVDHYRQAYNLTGVTVDEALKHEIVKQVYFGYKEKNGNENLCIRWECVYGA